MTVREKIEKLRVEMKKDGINYYIISSADAHQSEYVADYYRGRAYISGFTGSAGTVLIGLDKGILWTDGRYFIQAEDELRGSGIEMYKMRTPGWPTLEEWLYDNVKENECIGFDGKTFSAIQYKALLKMKEDKNLSIKMESDLLERFWSDRPRLPKEKAFYHDVKYCGKSAKEKINDVREEMKKIGVENYIITSLDDIAWLYNIRGNDIKNNPVVISYALITIEKAYLYIDKEKVDDDLDNTLNDNGIEIKSYNEINDDVKNLKESVYIDENKVSAYIYSCINKAVKIIEGTNITTKQKAIKNHIEIENLKQCQIRDGVAMVKFIKWLKEIVSNKEIGEVLVSEKLKEFRGLGELFKGTSFDTIAGYKDHAAMMHYSATKESEYTLKQEGMLLVDSGGQYLDGTTDITRTFVLGEISDEEKKDFTLVLKGHIALNNAKFLKGTTGSKLDAYARRPLWDEGLDYKCGTGHGVGFFLNVHEGPQGFTIAPNSVALEPGMIITNEPGVYKKGKHGIRIENTVVVKEYSKDEEMGEFYCFEVISLCPIDLEGVNVSLLDEKEKSWLNSYHKDVFNKLSPFLNDEEKEFLRMETRYI
ncbi:MAG: aminopeptidase P family protein [Clostridium sp.]